jgi:hypothetical protein
MTAQLRWIPLPKRSSGEAEEDTILFERICPDRSRSSSRPLPPPSSCFAKVTAVNTIEHESEKNGPLAIEKDEDELSLTEDSFSGGESLTPQKQPRSTQATPPSSIEAMKATRRRNNNLGASIRSFFDSFRDGDIEEVVFDLPLED